MRPALPLFACIATFVFSGCGDEIGKKDNALPDATRPSNTQPASVPTPTATGAAADNTHTNVRDDGRTLTPIDQSANTADTDITAAIRKAVIAEPNLSVNAQNAKIITTKGIVTLRGPVGSSTERTKLGSLAEQIAGVKHVDNQLEVVTR